MTLRDSNGLWGRTMRPTEDFGTCMHKISDLRKTILCLKRSALEQYQQDALPFKPLLDIRSDVEYWRNLAREKGIRVE